MPFDAHANLANASVATAPSPATSGTSLVVGSGQGSWFPAVPFDVTIGPAGALWNPSNAEIARCTARSGDTLTLTRAQYGTTARSIGVGDVVTAGITAKMLSDLEYGGAFGPATLTNATTTTETVVARWAIPADFWVGGARTSLAFRLQGHVSSTATLTWRVRIGTAGTTADTAAFTGAASAAGVANQRTEIDGMLAAITVGASGTCDCYAVSRLNTTLLYPTAAALATVALNTTVANFLSITLVQSAAQTFTPRIASLRAGV